MKNQDKKWEVIGKLKKTEIKADAIVDLLLKNRKIGRSQKAEFFKPKRPGDLIVSDFGIDERSLVSVKKRIKSAIKGKEKVVIYGDYDTDGVCATAIMWEALYGMGADVLPYLPDRFEEGYGLNPESVEKLKKEHPDLKLIVTVDNGIVADQAVRKANEFGIDTVITDHHQKADIVPDAYAIIHTDRTSGSGISWFLAKELSGMTQTDAALELAAVGTIADQLPLIGINRTIAKYGLEDLGRTKRPGLLELYKESGLSKNGPPLDGIGTYEVNYIIAPRINAMGRLEHAIDSLRLVCTKSKKRAQELALHLSNTNQKRQKIVEEVLNHARNLASAKQWPGVIVLSDSSYHEGVIGLAAGKLVEEYGRPALVISEGKNHSKGSARSIQGFNIIEAIREANDLLEGAGGHPMAAGFKLKTGNINSFIQRLEMISKPLLTPDILQKKLKIDAEISFSSIDTDLYKYLEEFEPTGLGNPLPCFVTRNVRIIDMRTVGTDGRHIKVKLEHSKKIIDAIGFGLGDKITKMKPGGLIDVAFGIDKNTWNGYTNLQLKLKDIHFSK